MISVAMLSAGALGAAVLACLTWQIRLVWAHLTYSIFLYFAWQFSEPLQMTSCIQLMHATSILQSDERFGLRGEEALCGALRTLAAWKP